MTPPVRPGRRTWAPAGLILIGLLLILLSLRPTPAPAPAPDAADTPRATAPRPTATHAPTAMARSATAAPTPTGVPPTTTPAPTATTRPPTATPQPPSPTPRPTVTQTRPAATQTRSAAPTPTSTAPPPAATATSGAIPYLARFGVSGGAGSVSAAAAAGLPFGSYLNWGASANPPRPNGAQFWQMVRVGEGGLRSPSFDDIALVLAAQPGAVWVIGNEPDVIVQDNVTPERYALIYHELYTFIKTRDPAAQVAIAGVAQPTPLRRAYLDRILTHYQATYGRPMPIDIWTVHAFIFREEAGSWGAGIPPGMGGPGRLYEIVDHDNQEIFQQNLLDFRAWLAARGYGNRPLAVTEYGVVMPQDYGFPPERVIAFMRASFDFFRGAANGDGDPSDGGRLVQYWFWFSVHDDYYATPNLYDPATGRLTPLGAAYAAYVRGE